MHVMPFSILIYSIEADLSRNVGSEGLRDMII